MKVKYVCKIKEWHQTHSVEITKITELKPEIPCMFCNNAVMVLKIVKEY